MDLQEYQNKTNMTAVYPDMGPRGIVYPALKLAGEAGEVAEKVGKVIRDGHSLDNGSLHRFELAKELGDVLWYIAQISEKLGFSLNEIADINIAKLTSRMQRGKIKGDGDNR